MTGGQLWRRLCHGRELAASLVYLRRCPFCGDVLQYGRAVDGCLCPKCAAGEKLILLNPQEIPAEGRTMAGLAGASAIYEYGETMTDVLLHCKLDGELWRVRELTDRLAVRLWDAAPAAQIGDRPRMKFEGDLRPYSCVVPVPPLRTPLGKPRIPYLMAKRLSAVLDIPMATPLKRGRQIQTQKMLTGDARQLKFQKTYRCRPGTNLNGARVLLVDDILTTGATASACALALQRAGAASVTAAVLAAGDPRRPAALPTENHS